MMKLVSNLKLTLLIFLLFFGETTFATTTDFTANGDISVEAITYSGGSADALILNGSSAESINYDSGVFTVKDPDATNTFKVASSDANIKTLRILDSGSSTVACAVNNTPGTSYVELPSTANTYTVELSETTDCQSLCPTVANAAAYNTYPTCGVATCASGYSLVSGACVALSSGGGGGSSVCDHFNFSNILPAPNATLISLKQISFQLPNTTDSKSIRIQLGTQELEFSLTQDEENNQYLITADISNLNLSPGQHKISLYAEKGSFCPISNIYFINISDVQNPSTANFSATAIFTDLLVDEWYFPFVEKLTNKNIFSGYSDGTFQPGKTLNRAEIAKITVQAFGIETSETSQDPFVDVPKESWFAPFVAALKQAEIVQGYSKIVPALQFDSILKIGSYGDNVKKLQEILFETGYYQGSLTAYFGPVTQQAVMNFQSDYPELKSSDGFGIVGKATINKLAELSGQTQTTTQQFFYPGRPITRAEALKIFLLGSGLTISEVSEAPFPDTPLDAWFTPFVAFAKEKGIISGFKNPDTNTVLFKPSQTITRAEATKILSLILDQLN